MSEITDPVVQHLVKLQLLEQESVFRTLLDEVQTKPAPEVRDLVIATVGTFMSLGKVNWPILVRAVRQLDKRTDAQLQGDVVAIVNGSHLVLPDTTDSAIILDIATLRPIADCPKALIATTYCLGPMWEATTA